MFGIETTNQGHECMKTYGQTSLSQSHNMANMYKKQLMEMVVNIRSADWLSKPNPIVTKLVSLTTRVTQTFTSCYRTINFYQLSTALAIIVNNSYNFQQLSNAFTAFTDGWLIALAALTRLHQLFNSFDRVSTVLSPNF